MWWEKKPEPTTWKKEETTPAPPSPAPSSGAVPVTSTNLDNPMTDTTLRASSSTASDQHQTLLGGSVMLKGELSGSEDLVIEGQFEGTISLKDHCLTVGPHGKVKADISARQVVINGSVSGKVSARDKIEIRKTGNVIGDLVSAGIAIEDGAYFKGSIEILREAKQEAPRPQATSRAAPITG